MSPVNGLPHERFLTFLELNDHSGRGMADLVHRYLTTELQLDFKNANDNAANMAGRYNGMQKKKSKKNIAIQFAFS